MFSQETIYAMNNPVPTDEDNQTCEVCEAPIVFFYLNGNLDRVCEACWEIEQNPDS